MTREARRSRLVLAVLAAAALAGTTGQRMRAAGPGPDDARAFIDQAEARLLELGNRLQRAQWVMSTYITQDTEQLAADANREYIAATMELAKGAKRFEGVALPDDVRRRLLLLKLSLPMPAPGDPKLQAELTETAAWLEGSYGRGKYCPAGKDCLDISAVERIMAESRDPAQLVDVWRGWHEVAPPMRPRYARFVELANAGSRELGFADTGALWRSNYDMPPDAFARELDRLWAQVRPLYLSLHAYVRRRLVERYGPSVVPPDGPIPAHLLGNLWAQSWSNVYPLVAPPQGDPGYDLTALLKAKKVDARQMVRYG
jgi:peptidyl-dipeptidase A